MSTTSLIITQPRTAILSRVLDYIELTKPRIAVLELLVVAAASCVATWGQPNPTLLLNAMLGTLLVAASASAANQWLERWTDGRMPRTAKRPLPAGRLNSGEALTFAVLTLVAGTLELALFTNWTCTGWAVLTWIVYVAAYTPLKRLSAVNTAVGAVAGALPVLIGWSASGAPIDGRALALATLLFVWQFPHFMAIAWLYRRDYAAAGLKMLTVVDPSGRRAGWQAAIAALALLPISLLPLLAAPGLGAVLYAAGALLLGCGQLALATLFWYRPCDHVARLLLKASLVYLSTLLAMLMLVPWV